MVAILSPRKLYVVMGVQVKNIFSVLKPKQMKEWGYLVSLPASTLGKAIYQDKWN